MTDDQIKHMVNRFLRWKLPENFNPDNGISFKPTFNDHMPKPTKHDPSGTNLFDATQAEAMVRHMVDGLDDGEKRQEEQEARFLRQQALTLALQANGSVGASKIIAEAVLIEAFILDGLEAVGKVASGEGIG